MRKAMRFAPDSAAEAFRAFGRWGAEHDPDGEMDILDAVTAYSKWAETNSIEKYLDAAQPGDNPTACGVSGLSTPSLHPSPPKSNQSEDGQ